MSAALGSEGGSVRYLAIQANKKISKIGLGTWQFGSSEWAYGEPYAEREARAIVRRALDLGVTFFDTAGIYGAGRSERILGAALAEHRNEVFLATKVFPIVPAIRAVTRSARASARRLGVARMDLLQVQWPNPLVPVSTIMGGMRSLRDSGTIDEVGVSNYSVRQWRKAEKALGSRILSNQVPYSLVARATEQELIPFATSRRRAIIAFSPLAHGLLSGRYHGSDRPADALRASDPLFSPEGVERTRELQAVLREIADAHDATSAQIALAWVIRAPMVAAIPGASSVRQLEDNVAAAEIRLSDDEYRALNSASAQFRQAGAIPGSGRPSVSTLRHLAKGALLVARTIRNDRGLRL